MPPRSLIHDAVSAMCPAPGVSPASRSATYASTVVDRSASPPAKFDQVPSARRCVGLLWRPDPQELPKQQVLSVHGDVGLQFALPPAVLLLPAKKMPDRPVQRFPRHFRHGLLARRAG